MNSFYDTLWMAILWHKNLLNSTTLEQSTYVDMSDKHCVAFLCMQEATSAEDIEGLKLVQATAAAGTGKKALTNASLTDAALINAAITDKFILEADAVAMDLENGFTFLAVEAAASATSTTLFLSVAAVAMPRYAHEELNVGTPSTDRVKVPAGGTAGS